jgi:hypothetical protein
MNHTCHANFCQTVTPEKYLMCPNHWFKVPKNLQAKVWQAFKGTTAADRCRSIPYMKACADAVEYIAKLEAKDLNNFYRRMVNILEAKNEVRNGI